MNEQKPDQQVSFNSRIQKFMDKEFNGKSNAYWMFNAYETSEIEDLLPAGIKAELLQSFGGEGQGDRFWMVYKLSDACTCTLVKVFGSYVSHYGTEYQGWRFVKGREETVMVYE